MLANQRQAQAPPEIATLVANVLTMVNTENPGSRLGVIPLACHHKAPPATFGHTRAVAFLCLHVPNWMPP